MPILDGPSGCPRPRWAFVLLMAGAWVAAAVEVRATLSHFSPHASERGQNLLDILLAGLGGVAFGGTIILVRSPLFRLILFPIAWFAVQAILLYLRAALLGHARDSLFQMSFWSAGGAVPESILMIAGYEVFARERIPWLTGRPFGRGLALFGALGGIVGVVSALNLARILSGISGLGFYLVLAAAGPLEFFILVYIAIWAVHRRFKPGRSEGNPASPQARNLRTESHLRAIALWFVIGGAGIGLSALVALALGPDSDLLDRSGGAPQIFWSAAAVLVPMAAISLAHAVVGHSLWRHARWARIAGGLLTLMLFLWQARQVETFNQVWGNLFAVASVLWLGAVAWVLFGSSAERLSTDEYRALVARTPEPAVHLYRSGFFWAPFVATVGGVFLVLFGLP